MPGVESVSPAPSANESVSNRFLAADLFCGAGGSSTGCARAIRAIGGELLLVCVNHDKTAIATHRRNHPSARHFIEDLNGADPERLVPERRLDLLMASPECRFHSRARGGKPINDQLRMSAYAVQRWLTAHRPRPGAIRRSVRTDVRRPAGHPT
jgi:DNA (cytosine-5)-methyltransferase 1